MGENAARAAWSGVGVALPRRFTTPRGLRLAVRRVLANPRYGERAKRVQEWSERHDGAVLASEVLERWVAGV
jgi:UDP:flavonoid glycosyltransferase YjiC (YdhE family)